MEFTLLHWTGIILAGIAQGFLNTVAGGGTLVTLPLLAFLGFDLSVANGTNRISVWAQGIASTISYKKKKILSLKQASPYAVMSMLGAVIGAGIAVNVNRQILNITIALLILLMSMLLLFKPQLWENGTSIRWPRWSILLLFIALGVYGGFIEAGVGFYYSWALVSTSGIDLLKGNGIKALITAVYTPVALVVFYINGMVNVLVGLVLALGSALGAYWGAHMSVVKGSGWIRSILLCVTLVSTLKLLYDAFFH